MEGAGGKDHGFDMDATMAEVGRLMALAARTAPKGRGQDHINVRLLTGDDVHRLGEGMVARGKRRDNQFFVRDGGSVHQSSAVLLLTLLDHPALGLDCNACGFGSCAGLARAREGAPEGDYPGPVCVIKALDLGVAVGSAAKTAQLHNADSRVMYTAAVTAIELGLTVPGLCLALPIAATGKSPFFDR